MEQRKIRNTDLKILWSMDLYSLNGVKLTKKLISEIVDGLNTTLNLIREIEDDELPRIKVTGNLTKDKIEIITLDSQKTKTKIIIQRNKNTIQLDNIILHLHDLESDEIYDALLTANIVKENELKYHECFLKKGFDLRLFISVLMRCLSYFFFVVDGSEEVVYISSPVTDDFEDPFVIFRVEEILVKH